MNERFDNIRSHLQLCDTVYRYKRKRLGFMKRASVSREMRELRDNFDRLWMRRKGMYRLKTTEFSAKSIDIICGLFGGFKEAGIILRGNKDILSIDRVAFNQFLIQHVASSRAVENLYSKFYGENKESIENIVCLQIPYLERYLPVFNSFESLSMEQLELSENEVTDVWSIIELFDTIQDNFEKDILLYKRFKKDFTKLYREKVSLRILGYGEISTVMQLAKGSHMDSEYQPKSIEDSGMVWKRMPPLSSFEEVKQLERVYSQYRTLLNEKIGISVPVQQFRYFKNNGTYTIYAGQVKLNPDFVGHILVRRLDVDNAIRLFGLVLDQLEKWYMFNHENNNIKAGLDGQISNWVLKSSDGALNYVSKNDCLMYIDTSTPLYRVDNEEQLNAELFLKNTPSFLRVFIRIFFLQNVLDRYYDVRSVIIDCIANLYKEQREDLIIFFVPVANMFLERISGQFEPLTEKEIRKYYQEDAFIWKLFQFSRKVDRFITEKIFRKRYTYRLPGKVTR